MRVTDNIRLSQLNRNLSELSSRHAEAANVAGSGLRIHRASDDALGAAQLMRIRASIKQTDTYRRNVSQVRDDARMTESALAQSMELFTRAREIAMQGANDSLKLENREALAGEVRALREELIALGNTQGATGYLFAGDQIASPAFDAGGGFVGDNGTRDVEIGPRVTMRVDVNGNQAFSGASGGIDAFNQLNLLEGALMSNDSASISATLDGLDTAREQLGVARSESGLIINRLDAAEASLEVSRLNLAERQSGVADADMFQAISQLTALSTTLEQAISVARTTLNTNLSRF